MAASSADFQWYNDADDDHPIGQGPTETPTAPSSPPTPGPSAGPSSRVRQLRGQPKLAINLSSTGHTPAKVVAKTRRKNTRKRPHADDDKGPTRKSRKTTAKGKKGTAIPVDSEPETDDATSDDDESSSDDDGDLSVKDKCVSLSRVI